MPFPPGAVLLVRISAAFWIVTGPALWLMAAIAPEESVQALDWQQLVVTGLAFMAVVFGLLALVPSVSAARVLHVLSWFSAAVCFGLAMYALVFPFVPWTTLKDPGTAGFPLALLLSAVNITFGMPFVVVALLLGHAFRLRKAASAQPRLSS